MSEVVFFLEEPSAQAMLEGLLPRLCAPAVVRVRYIVFEGKQDLERQLVRRMRGYRTPGARFVVLRDKDAADCIRVKDQLRLKCREAGKTDVLIRIAVHELESWYLGDLAAVAAGLNIDRLEEKQNRAKYREPDSLANAADELRKLTNFAYQKIAGSRAIGPHLSLDDNRSHSFAVLVAGLRELFAALRGDQEP